MKAFWATAVVGLALMGSIDPASAQFRGDDGFRDGGRRLDDGGRGRGRNFDDDDDDRGRGRGRGRGDGGFNEAAYLRCNPDVRRSVNRGHTESGAEHYRLYGRREGRTLNC